VDDPAKAPRFGYVPGVLIPAQMDAPTTMEGPDEGPEPASRPGAAPTATRTAAVVAMAEPVPEDKSKEPPEDSIDGGRGVIRLLRPNKDDIIQRPYKDNSAALPGFGGNQSICHFPSDEFLVKCSCQGGLSI
jgi:hypothetical protein